MSGPDLGRGASGSTVRAPGAATPAGDGPMPSPGRAMSTISGAASAEAKERSWVASTSMQHEFFEQLSAGDLSKLKRIVPLALQLLTPQQYAAVMASASSPRPVPAVDLAARGADNWTMYHYGARKGQTAALQFVVETVLKAGMPEAWVAEQVSPRLVEEASGVGECGISVASLCSHRLSSLPPRPAPA